MRMTNNLEELQNTIGIKFTNKSLLKTALTHRSYLNESKQKIQSNERLEFLGDAVLELIVSNHLYKTYPNLPEGQLTNLRSAIVKTETLAKIAQDIKLGEYLYLSKGEERGGGRTNTSLLADTFEALLGSIYLDQGLGKAKSVVEKLLLPLLPNIIKTRSYIDYKSKLQTIIQDRKKPAPTYKVIKETGPDHNKIFDVVSLVSDKIIGKGRGKNKQQAEQEAAKDALSKLEKKEY